jgi:hypothetical protein
MIKHEVFKKKMEEARDLLGSAMKISAFDTMYDRFKDWYDTQDFTQGIDAVVEDGSKLIYPVIRKSMDKYRERRVEAEIRSQKSKEVKEMGRVERTRGEIADVQSIVKDLEKRMAFEPGEFPEIPFVKYNTVLVHESGFKEDCYIDQNQPGFEEAVTIVHEQDGESIRRRVVLDTTGLKIVSKTAGRKTA